MGIGSVEVEIMKIVVSLGPSELSVIQSWPCDGVHKKRVDYISTYELTLNNDSIETIVHLLLLIQYARLKIKD